jgi:Flp pilus assembly protein TadG
MPIFAICVFGMCGFGLLFNQYLTLTEAVNIGGQQLSVARNNWADPCKQIATDVESAAPYLNGSNTAFNFTLNGTAYNFAKNASVTCTAGATTLTSAGPGATVTLSVTYSCSLGVFDVTFGKLVQFNPLPTSSCSLTSSISEILQ